MIERTFTFGGATRLDLGLGTPNVAAVLIVCMLSLLWQTNEIARSNRANPAFYWSAVLLEMVLVAALAATFSRGGIVAYGVTYAHWLMRLAYLRWRNSPMPMERTTASRWRVEAVRVVVSGTILFFCGGATRIAPTHAVDDQSISNRFDVWEGAWHLMRLKPFGLSSLEEAGCLYQQWLQPTGKTGSYTVFMNIFMDAGLSFGIGPASVLCAVVSIGIVAPFLITGQSKPGSHEMVLGAYSTVLCAFTVGNLFSSAYADPVLSIFLAGCTIGAGWALRSFRPVWSRPRLAVAGIAGVLAIPAGAFCLRPVPTDRAWPVAITDQYVDIECAGKPGDLPPRAPSVVYAFPDQEVLGERYGHVIRGMILRSDSPAVWRIFRPDINELVRVPRGRRHEVAVMFGRQAGRHFVFPRDLHGVVDAFGTRTQPLEGHRYSSIGNKYHLVAESPLARDREVGITELADSVCDQLSQIARDARDQPPEGKPAWTSVPLVQEP